MSFPRRRPNEIAFEIFKCVEEKGEVTRWDLIKILGTTAQFREWIDNFLLKSKFLEERHGGGHTFLKMTENGKDLYNLLKKDELMVAFSRLSGKRLRKL